MILDYKKTSRQYFMDVKYIYNQLLILNALMYKVNCCNIIDYDF